MKTASALILCLVILSCGKTDFNTAIREAEKPLVQGLAEGPETKPASRPRPIGPGIWDVDSEHWIALAVKLDPNLDVKETALSWTEHGAAYFTRTPEGVTVFLAPHASFEDNGVVLFLREEDGYLSGAKALAYRFRDFGPPFTFPIKLTSGTLQMKSMNLKPGSQAEARFTLAGGNELTGSFIGEIP